MMMVMMMKRKKKKVTTMLIAIEDGMSPCLKAARTRIGSVGLYIGVRAWSNQKR